MAQIQEVFQRIEDNRKKLKDVQSVLKDALSTSQAYQEASEEAKRLNEKKKQIKRDIEGGFGSEITQVEDLKIDIESDKQLLTDMAITQMMKGENIGVSDTYENEYEPVFTVKFKKIS
ncbi:MAG: hypothetical protein HOL80_01190 [Candidatus Magasanikbacteria bacterium]|jgi:hypothetical protein|nr:hypothetical protein [Candidatus Magasanikbacteria bacterium]MBT5262496.1 hypothetical protein [Candidatus Magasanikbacteria bacterium]MBT5819984.1 hypothetical protein [Candidatus Magasanikbacteria bacterium]MBT6294735.1 hypothetical protein [Candidatus Magasanikbacteria bacterium]|tara:strand:- start:619 stop:972 length:354 start_codon:yes stop_codon:yes gene_type:complete